jgi:hypothetical protein
MIDRAPSWQIMRQQFPSTATANCVTNPIQDLSLSLLTRNGPSTYRPRSIFGAEINSSLALSDLRNGKKGLGTTFLTCTL